MASDTLTESLRETLAVFDTTGAPQTTTEVASTLDLGRRSTYDRLQRLVDRDRLATKKVGASARVWWRRAERGISERQLQRYETLFEQSRDVNAVVDDEARFQMLTPSVENVLGYEPADLVGDRGFEYIHPEDRETAMREFSAMSTDPSYEPTVEFRFAHNDGSWVDLEVQARNLLDDPDIGGIVVYTRDVTARNEREEKLHQQVTQQEVVTELGQCALERHDIDDLLTEATRLVAETLDTDYCKVLDLDDEGESLCLRAGVGWDEGVVGATTVSASDDDSQAAATLDRTEPVVVEDFRTEDRFSGPPLLCDHGVKSGIGVVIGTPADSWGVLGTHDTDSRAYSTEEVNFVQSVANVLAGALDRQTYERELVGQRTELRRREGALRSASEVMSRPQSSLSAQLEDLLAVVAGTLDTACTGLVTESDGEVVFEYVVTPDGAGPAQGDAVPDEISTACRQVMASSRRVMDDESSFLGVPVAVDGEAYGTLCCAGGKRASATFSDWEIAFAELVANWMRSEHQRNHYTDRLAALNELNAVAREITDAVIDQSTRSEIEQTVCDHLAATDSYRFAWVGDVDVTTQTVTLTAEAGVEGYLDGITISVDPDDERSEGPTGRALRTGEMQVTQDTETDSRHDPWRSHVQAHDFRSSAAVPIVHDESVYGVLNIYAGRPRAFEGEEATVLRQLGEVVGHAIAATERKRALMSDEVVELEFQIPTLERALDVGASLSGHVELAHAVPVGDGEYLVYGTADTDGIESLHTLVDEVSHWKSVTARGDTRADGKFELRLSEPPVLSLVAAVGGSVDRAVLEDGEFTLSLSLSPAADVHHVIDAVQEAYPTAQLLKRHQRSRAERPAERLQAVLTETLTERQRAVLRVAYHAGFFEWPRDASGETIAESLGVSGPTFHQHLRTAERKVLDAVLTDTLHHSG